jgi:zinc transporter ZupT
MENQEQFSDVNKSSHHFEATSPLTPYLLLLALTVHSMFEGFAIGLQTNY